MTYSLERPIRNRIVWVMINMIVLPVLPFRLQVVSSFVQMEKTGNSITKSNYTNLSTKLGRWIIGYHFHDGSWRYPCCRCVLFYSPVTDSARRYSIPLKCSLTYSTYRKNLRIHCSLIAQSQILVWTQVTENCRKSFLLKR